MAGVKRVPKIYLCGVDDGRREVPNPSCPQAVLHTPAPPGYLEWHAWADEMSKTHRQTQCPSCRLFTIWTPKNA